MAIVPAMQNVHPTRNWDRFGLIIYLIAGICVLAAPSSAGVVGERCDWSGSGQSTAGRGVTPVYLRCAAGSLKWTSPRGALRVLLRVGTGKEFRGCIRLTTKAGDKLARVFLEVPESLSLLYPSPVRCFESRNGQAALFIEATSIGPIVSASSAEVFALDYDLEPLPRGKRYRPSDECKPCSQQQMLRAYCTSDLVVRGHIKSVEEDDEDPDSARVSVRVTKWLRRLGAEDNALPDALAPLPKVTLSLPRHCGARHGAGEFVLMARKKLGRLTLGCAPRLDEWVAATTDADGARCVLHT